jgi:hypothetical protein
MIVPWMPDGDAERSAGRLDDPWVLKHEFDGVLRCLKAQLSA